MQSLGIDLSTDPKKVWICEIDWGEPAPRVVALQRASTLQDPRAADRAEAARPVRDEAGLVAALVERLIAFDPGPERVAGIDAPFGWPSAFVDAVSDWEAGDLQGFRKRPELRLRATDRFVQAASGVTPLSVSVDRIGSTAMLCAEVLSRLARRLDQPRVDRARALSGVAEVYPAAALRMWTTTEGAQLPAVGYKTELGARQQLAAALLGVQGEWEAPTSTQPMAQHAGLGAAGLVVPSEFHQPLTWHDDALDALICALVARAIALDRCHAIDRPITGASLYAKRDSERAARGLPARVTRARELQQEAAQVADAEGWIHIPEAGPLREGIGLSTGPKAAANTACPRVQAVVDEVGTAG